MTKDRISERLAHLTKLSLGCVGILLLLTACIAPKKYTPFVKDITLRADTMAPTSLPMTVQMTKLVDVSPTEDKEDGWIYWSGWSVTSPDRLRGSLDVALTEAIMGDLKEHKVFNDLTQENKAGQLRLDGKVHKFYQRREQYLWTLCCGLLGIVLPFPLMKEEGAVDIELALIQPDGTTIKSYRGKSSFLKRCNFYESRCNESYNRSPAKYLDEAFGESMSQIRKELVRDKDLIVQRVSNGLLKSESRVGGGQF